MADTVTVVGIQFKAIGGSNVEKAFKRLGRETGLLKRNFSALSSKELMNVKRQLLGVNQATGNSINSMQAQKVALQGLRNMADVTGREFKELTRDIAILDQKMKRASAGGGAGGLKSRLKGLAKGAGAIAAGGIFGGPEGAVGGAIGLTMGGPAGAAVGAAVGAQVGMVRQSVGEIATYNAALERQRKALKLVINDVGKYSKSQQFLASTSKKLAIPQDVIVRQFTSLTASVIGAGKSVEDAEEVFKAIAAGIRGTGGNLEDMKAAMRATAQVFSKGKVSAEELRQQLGERLPGAFTLFADSMGKTPAELDKALEQGKVTLDDFMEFAKKLFATYGVNAEILAKGPEAAGDRLQTAISELKDNLGEPLSAIGAMFQEMAATAVEGVNKISKVVENELAKGMTRSIAKRTQDIKKLEQNTREAFEELRYAASGRSRTVIQELIPDADGNMILTERLLTGKEAIVIARQRYEAAKAAQDENLEKLLADKERRDAILAKDMKPKEINGMLFHPVTYQYLGQADGSEDPSKAFDTTDNEKPLNSMQQGMQQGVKQYFDTIKSFAEETAQLVNDAFKGMEDALVNFVMTGKLNFTELANSILADMARIAIRQAIIKPLMGAIFPFLENANGNAFAANGVVPYRKGGVVNSPTYFKYGGSNLGIMGEAGPEAIMPLKRGRGGKLGVIAQGGGAANINVNVDASGSSVEGDEGAGRKLGEVIATAIQAQLIEQKRPGGILA